MTCLFVGNLTKSLTEQNLIVAFSEIGPCKVELKGPYAFIEYENASDSKEAMRKLNKTTLNGANGYSKVRIEFSKKKKVNDKLEDNDNNTNPLGKNNDIDLQEPSLETKPTYKRYNNSNNNKGKRDDDEAPRKNVCFICKLPGHFAKECQAGVREAKTLTKNRVKAVFSQQSAYRFVTPKTTLQNIMKYIQENGIN